MDECLKRFNRVRKRSEFERVFRRGQFYKGTHIHLWIYCLESQQEAGPRLGVIVSRRTAADAHQRNRLKRLVREAFRRLKNKIPQNTAVVVRVMRKKLLTYDDVYHALQERFEEAGLLR